MVEMIKYPQCSELVRFHLEKLISAIKKVDHKYLWYDSTVAEVEFSEKQQKSKEHLERVFAYELYHKWREVLENACSNLTINAEINKVVFDKQKEKETTVFPDFVLHSGQEKTDNQLFACEVKRRLGTNHTQIAQDIDALISYLDNSLFDFPFEFAIFLLVGAEQDYLKEEINKCDNRNWLKFAHRIICITYNWNYLNKEYSFSLESLYSIIDNHR